MKNPEKLTEKETTLFNEIRKGMDRENCGWLHEIAPRCGMKGKTLSGVVGSLIKKGVIHSYEDEDGIDCFWVNVAKEYEMEVEEYIPAR